MSEKDDPGRRREGKGPMNPRLPRGRGSPVESSRPILRSAPPTIPRRLDRLGYGSTFRRGLLNRDLDSSWTSGKATRTEDVASSQPNITQDSPRRETGTMASTTRDLESSWTAGNARMQEVGYGEFMGVSTSGTSFQTPFARNLDHSWTACKARVQEVDYGEFMGVSRSGTSFQTRFARNFDSSWTACQARMQEVGDISLEPPFVQTNMTLDSPRRVTGTPTFSTGTPTFSTRTTVTRTNITQDSPRRESTLPNVRQAFSSPHVPYGNFGESSSSGRDPYRHFGSVRSKDSWVPRTPGMNSLLVF